MGLFDFLKKTKPEPIVAKPLLKKELPEWIKNKTKEHSDSKEEIIKTIKERIYTLTSELNTQIAEFENIEFKTKSPNPRIESMARGNIKNYETYLTKLINELNQINDIENIIENINAIIKNFEEKSNITYQKIIYVSAKEVKATKNSIRLFLKDLEEILKTNKNLFEEFKLINEVKTNLEKLTKIQNDEIQTKENLTKENSQIENLNKDLETEKIKLKEYLTSPNHLERKEQLKLLTDSKQLIIKEIEKLSSQIDFKLLSNFFHKFENEMLLVKQYRENLFEAINHLGFQPLEKLLNESNLNNEKIKDTINSIKNKQKETNNFQINEDKSNIFEHKINSINSKIQSHSTNKTLLETKITNLEKEQNQINERIKIELNKLNLIFE